MVTKTDAKQIGYKGHSAGSREKQVQSLFDDKRPEAAKKLALENGLKTGTIKSWFGFWRGADGKPATEDRVNPALSWP